MLPPINLAYIEAVVALACAGLIWQTECLMRMGCMLPFNLMFGDP